MSTGTDIGIGALAGGGLGAGLGLLSALGKANADRRNRELQAITAQYSPWTHMSPDQKSLETTPNPLGDVASGAFAGYDQIQKANQASKINKLLEKQIESPSSGSTAVSIGVGPQAGVDSGLVPAPRLNPWDLAGLLGRG